MSLNRIIVLFFFIMIFLSLIVSIKIFTPSKTGATIHSSFSMENENENNFHL